MGLSSLQIVDRAVNTFVVACKCRPTEIRFHSREVLEAFFGDFPLWDTEWLCGMRVCYDPTVGREEMILEAKLDYASDGRLPVNDAS